MTHPEKWVETAHQVESWRKRSCLAPEVGGNKAFHENQTHKPWPYVGMESEPRRVIWNKSHQMNIVTPKQVTIWGLLAEGRKERKSISRDTHHPESMRINPP